MKNEIEVVRINKLNGESKIKAFCDISLFGTLVIKGLKVVTGENETFVTMPSEKGKDGKWYSIVYFLSEEMKKVVSATVLNAYGE